MHYYQFHIGDYLRDTAHLTLEEDATYRRLLDFYYEAESPVPNDFVLVARKIRSKPSLVELILTEYFTADPRGYIHARVEAELKAYHDMVNGGKKGAAKRWDKGGDGQGIPTPSGGDGQGIATGMLTMNHEPRTMNQVNPSAQFAEFWIAYPKKKNKGDAEKAWKAISPGTDLITKILNALLQAKQSKDWLKESGKYIPYPASWLRAKGWEDEYAVREEKRFVI